MVLTVDIKKLIYISLLIPLLQPDIVNQVPVLEVIYNVLKLISYVTILMLFIRKRKRLDSFLSLTVVYCVIRLIATFVNQSNSLYIVIAQSANILAIIMLMELTMDKGPLFCFDVFLPVVEVLLYLNLISIILFPKGLYTVLDAKNSLLTDNWILGIDNCQFPYYLLGITVSVCKSYYQRNKMELSLRSVLLIGVCIITVLIRRQATALVGMTLIALAIFVPKFIHKARTSRYWTYMLITAMLFLLFVIFQNFNIIAFLVNVLLEKDLTLSGRTAIWNFTIPRILEKPLLGWGVQTAAGSLKYFHHVHAHNFMLQICFEGGVFCGITYILLLVSIGKRVSKNYNHIIPAFLAASVFSLTIACFAEPYGSANAFAIYYLAYNADKIVSAQIKGLSHLD